MAFNLYLLFLVYFAISQSNFSLSISTVFHAHSVTGTLMLYLYYQGLHSEQAKLDSKYYQRFIAKKDEGHH
jgi:hypothetical protein